MSSGTNTGFVLDPADSVATLPWGGEAGAPLVLASGGTPGPAPRLLEPIPPGHKCALRDIPAGAPVVKYGLPIGHATGAIAAGAHVHVHNIASALSPAARDADRAAPRRLPREALEHALDTILERAGAGPAAARAIAHHLAMAEASGVETHGLRRLAPMLARLRAGGIDGRAEPEIAVAGAVISVDGRNGPGHYVALRAAEAAVTVAAELGAAVALVRDSSHFGYAGHYAARIARVGMVGIAISNGQVLVGPPGGRRAIFSNNPLAVAAPLGEDGLFEFDMAASVTSRARIAAAAERGAPIPEGLALDAAGRPTRDAAEALRGILLPLGGAKGFGLIAALEVLTGVLPGGAYADLVASKEAGADRAEGTSHCLIAIAPGVAGGDAALRARMADLAARVARLPMAEGADPARLPGSRREARRKAAETKGVPLSDHAWTALEEAARAAGVPLPEPEGPA